MTGTRGYLNLDVPRALAFAATNVPLVSRDGVVVLDGGTALTDLTSTQIAKLRERGFVGLDGGVDVWRLSADDFTALGGMSLLGGGYIGISDEGAKIALLNIQVLRNKSITFLDATDNKLSLSYLQYLALGGSATGNIELNSGDVVSLADQGGLIAGLTLSELAAKGIDVLDVLDGRVLTIDVSQALKYMAASVGMADDDVVAVADSAVSVSSLTVDQLRAFDAKKITFIDLTDGHGNEGNFQLGWSVDKVKAFGTGSAVWRAATASECTAAPTNSGITRRRISRALPPPPPSSSTRPRIHGPSMPTRSRLSAQPATWSPTTPSRLPPAPAA